MSNFGCEELSEIFGLILNKITFNTDWNEEYKDELDIYSKDYCIKRIRNYELFKVN